MAEVELNQVGRVGHIRLNRPKALNALTHQMCLDIEEAFDRWIIDPTIKMFLIDAVGDKAFCAGGDVVDLYESGQRQDYKHGQDFWRDEYRLNAKIGACPKPFVAVMDGIVMGGGVGVSAHCSHRIVTERTMFALPECSIGLIPDVGGSHLLAKMPGYCGEYAGLSGARLSGADCIYADLADYFLDLDKLEDLTAALLVSADPSIISDYVSEPDPSSLEAKQNQIDDYFSAEKVEDIIGHLAKDDSEFAQKTLKAILKSPPISLLATLATVREARDNPGLVPALKREYRFVSRSMKKGDFLEGVRAAIIDKDRTPLWTYPTIDEVPCNWREIIDLPAPGGDFEFS